MLPLTGPPGVIDTEGARLLAVSIFAEVIGGNTNRFG